LFECCKFWDVVVDDVRIVRIAFQIILMMLLGFKECDEGYDFSRDGFVERLRRIECGDKSVGRFPLRRIHVKDRTSILSSNIGALTIHFGRIVSDDKKDIQELFVRYFRRIKSDLYRLGVSCVTATNVTVIRRLARAARVTRSNSDNSLNMLEYCFDAPKATAGEYRLLLGGERGKRKRQ